MSSSTDLAVQVRGLSKAYTIAHNAQQHSTAAEALLHRLKNPLQKPDKETFWALRDVEFDIYKGDVVGIIGRNGAGKSTLLKVLSRITEPTTGQIDLYGRVGSLLEVGTGFHPELTGRENVFLNGAILGMSKREITREFDAIVDFSGTEQFLDTPVKRYSSGMYVRLAFAVAAHLNNEILIVDEVLAVGDYAFQKKCLGRMEDVSQSGRTVLVVSHNMTVLNEIAKTAVWLEKGVVKASGPLPAILSEYMSDQLALNGSWQLEKWDDKHIASVTGIKIHQSGEDSAGEIAINEDFTFEVNYSLRQTMPFCRVGIEIHTSTGIAVLSTAEPDAHPDAFCDKAAGDYTSVCTVPAWLLSPGSYVITTHIDSDPLARHFTAAEILRFDVKETELRGPVHYGRPGVVGPKLDWRITSAK